jgi:HPt (histidine-containing phosphotransfer) domain-containing protein
MTILDQSILDDLRELDRMGDGKFLRQIIGVFEEQAVEIVRQLEQAASQLDMSTLAALAHKLKGSARTVGAVELGDHCERLEHEARAGQVPELPALMSELVASVGRAKAILREQI